MVSEATRGIWILDPQEPKSQPELLVDDRTLPNVGLAWSPDGRRLAYAVAEHDERRPWQPSFGVWILDLDTGSKEQISTCDPSACPRLIDWSPDGSRLALTDSYGLYVMDLDGNQGPSIAAFPGGEIGQPSWSPDGSRIVFSVRNGTFPDYGPSQLYTIAPDGSDLTLVLERPFNGALDPMWSPDGSQIAYWDWGTDEAYVPESATEASFPKIWVVDADGSNPTKVYVDRSGTVGPGSYYGGVSWSPDGTQLAFIIAYQFYVIDADGTDLRTDLFGNGFGDDGFALRPAWQPVPGGSLVVMQTFLDPARAPAQRGQGPERRRSRRRRRLGHDGLASPQEDRRARRDPQSGDPNEAVDDPRRGVRLTEVETEQGRHEIELGQGDQTPVEGPDDHQRQRNSIHHLHVRTSFAMRFVNVSHLVPTRSDTTANS